MTEFVTPARFYEYRGEKLLFRSGGGTYQRVTVSGELTLARFPEALEFSTDPADPWVMLPTSAFDAAYEREVSGRWHDVPVSVGSTIRSGLHRGLVQIFYEGNRPDEAVAAGLRGNQNDGWYAEVDPSEIDDISVTETMYPMVGG
ncbi:hypothetical protein AB1K54_15945 [Microbacterium sp. BWT-B31]|uniref:hypothetical protein n=1 Tax=Microbacterium sp. BWT-B31 TaxID=3232072 RepID=UPI003526D557